MEFKRLRRAAGLTQYELCRRARVPRTKIADVEAGRGRYAEEELTRIAKVLTDAMNKNLDQLIALPITGREGCSD